MTSDAKRRYLKKRRSGRRDVRDERRARRPRRRALARCDGADFMDDSPFGKCKEQPTHYVSIWLGVARAEFAMCDEHATSIASFCKHYGLDCKREPLP